jgi:hypothetical protein
VAAPLTPEARQRRRLLGMALMAAGLLPFFGMMAYIVVIRHPSPLVIASTLACWGVFFTGKTILKNADLSAYR